MGAGKFCIDFLQLLMRQEFQNNLVTIQGVADINSKAPGIQFALNHGIDVTDDYTTFFQKHRLNLIIELTCDEALADKIRMQMPDHLELIDHFEAMILWDSLRIDMEKQNCLKRLKELRANQTEIQQAIETFSQSAVVIAEERCRYSHRIEKESIRQQQTISQIIQGSTIPTFVIDRNHVLTHWNKALEKLTGFLAKDVVGTTRQWAPFWDRERPSMADVILDQIGADEIQKLYGAKWQKSALIENAYEAEIFFPKLEKEGKWCFFTAAPIKAKNGEIIGAIETLWDTTERKKAEQEREQRTRELSTLCTIYAALNAPDHITGRVQTAIEEVKRFLCADCVSIFLADKKGGFRLQYRDQTHDSSCAELPVALYAEMAMQATAEGKLIISNDLSQQTGSGYGSDIPKSIAIIPISTKEHKSMGAMVIGSRAANRFSYTDQHILELIGNRIGAAIENAILQEQYIKSEEKYRSLFNNDPNPIFILDPATHRILDVNQRVADCYGYLSDEMIGQSFLMLGDESDDEIQKSMRNLGIDQSVLMTKKRHYRKGRNPFHVNINIRRAHYGDIDVMIASTTDITETIEKETQLIQAGKMATLGTMAAGMAHELNQPLNVIQVCADYFLKMTQKKATIPDEDLISISQDISRNIRRATEIIRHMRDFARQSEVVRSRVCINDPIRDVFKVLGHQIKAHQIELTLSLNPDIGFILADHNRLEQVFVNLVSNAIDALDEKETNIQSASFAKRIHIHTSRDGDRVTVRVQDNGIGMSKDTQKRIFEPFFTTKKIGKGTGLGVSISYGIIRDYDGVIHTESTPGQGTTFTLSFPALRE